MSLGRLLAAGKSLVGVRDNESRYRMNKQAALPKFGSPKNPFAPPGGDADGSEAPRKLSPEETSAASLKETQKLPAAVTHRSTAKRTSGLQPGTQARAAASGWARKLNPMQFGARSKPLSKPGLARLSSVPVQGELSMDKVKVVRNDLTDADLEVVPVKPAVRNEEARPGLQTVARGGRSESPWGRFATRIFGAT